MNNSFEKRKTANIGKNGKRKVLLIAMLVALFGVMTTACGTKDNNDNNNKTETTTDNKENNTSNTNNNGNNTNSNGNTTNNNVTDDKRTDTNGDGVLDDIGNDIKDGVEDIGDDVSKGVNDLENKNTER